MKAFFLAASVVVLALGCSSSSDAGTSGPCSDQECGGLPPVHCADGSPGSATCVRGSNGTCGWQFDCPADSGLHDTGNGDTAASDTATSDAPSESASDGDADQ